MCLSQEYFSALKQETVWVVFSRPVDGWDGLLRIYWSRVAEGCTIHSGFHRVHASS